MGIRVLLTTRPTGFLIRLVTWSEFSHVALIDGDSVLEAVAFHGVRRRPLGEAIADSSKAAIVTFACDNPDNAIAYAVSQLGKPYDWTALVGLGLHRDWQEDDSWFCSEYFAACMQKADNPLFRAESMHRIVPQHVYQLAAESTEYVKGF